MKRYLYFNSASMLSQLKSPFYKILNFSCVELTKNEAIILKLKYPDKIRLYQNIDFIHVEINDNDYNAINLLNELREENG